MYKWDSNPDSEKELVELQTNTQLVQTEIFLIQITSCLKQALILSLAGLSAGYLRLGQLNNNHHHKNEYQSNQTQTDDHPQAGSFLLAAVLS